MAALLVERSLPHPAFLDAYWVVGVGRALPSSPVGRATQVSIYLLGGGANSRAPLLSMAALTVEHAYASSRWRPSRWRRWRPFWQLILSIAPVETMDKARAVAPTPFLSSGEVLDFSPVPRSQIEPSPLVNLFFLYNIWLCNRGASLRVSMKISSIKTAK